jgi:hypothetical protein
VSLFSKKVLGNQYINSGNKMRHLQLFIHKLEK